MHLKSCVFPYGITLRDSGVIDIFPAAEVFFKSQEGAWLSIFLIVDSGATVSALPKSDADFFGIVAERGKAVQVGGINGALTGWQHDISIRFGGVEFTVPFVFLAGDFVPRVLGRAGIFEHFAIIFDEERRASSFLAYGKREIESIRAVLKKIKA